MQTMEGDGMDVMRPFPAGTLSYFDPFLLLDRLGPVTFAPGAAKGVPPHPHRGFETITYLLSGRIAHRDSRGGSGTLGPGDVQVMRAGSGIVHSEMPDDAVLAYALEGTGTAGADQRSFAANQLIVFGAEGARIDLAADDAANVEVIVIAARPLGEPVARYGPFVMNTPHEVTQAIDD